MGKLARSPWLISGSIALALSPVIVGPIGEIAAAHGALSDSGLSLARRLYFDLSLPGRLLLGTVGLDAAWTSPHATGMLFWRELILLLIANLSGWWLVLYSSAALGLAALRRAHSSAKSE